MYKPATKRAKATITCKLDNNFTKLIEHYKTLGLTFEAHIGGKSHTLIFDNLREKYVTDFIKIQAFIGARMIQRDVNREDVLLTLSDIRDSINEDDNRYYHSKPIIPPNIGDCYLVDINSAYLSVLKNFGLITDKTFNYINFKCPKKERLVAVGMLAQRKFVYQIESGNVTCEPEIIEATTRYLFNLCIQEVDDAMQKIAKELSDSYLFYWVDGIYLKTKDAGARAMEILSESGFKSKIIQLKDFKCLEMFIRKEVSFIELKEDGTEKKKIFRIPNPLLQREYRNDMRRILEPTIKEKAI